MQSDIDAKAKVNDALEHSSLVLVAEVLAARARQASESRLEQCKAECRQLAELLEQWLDFVKDKERYGE